MIPSNVKSLQVITPLHYTLDTLVHSIDKRVIRWILFSLNLFRKYLLKLDIPYWVSLLLYFAGLSYDRKVLEALYFNQSLIRQKRVGIFYSLFATYSFLKSVQLYPSTQWGICQ